MEPMCTTSVGDPETRAREDVGAVPSLHLKNATMATLMTAMAAAATAGSNAAGSVRTGDHVLEAIVETAKSPVKKRVTTAIPRMGTDAQVRAVSRRDLRA